MANNELSSVAEGKESVHDMLKKIEDAAKDALKQRVDRTQSTRPSGAADGGPLEAWSDR